MRMLVQKQPETIYTGDLLINEREGSVRLLLNTVAASPAGRYADPAAYAQRYQLLSFEQFYLKPSVQEQEELHPDDLEMLKNTKRILAIKHPKSLLSLVRQGSVESAATVDRASQKSSFNSHGSAPKRIALNAVLDGLSDEEFLKVYKALQEDNLYRKIYPLLDELNLARCITTSHQESRAAKIRQKDQPSLAVG